MILQRKRVLEMLTLDDVRTPRDFLYKVPEARGL